MSDNENELLLKRIDELQERLSAKDREIEHLKQELQNQIDIHEDWLDNQEWADQLEAEDREKNER